MPRKRVYLSQEAQGKIRKKITDFGPVSFMVEILQKPTWKELQSFKNDEGEEKEAVIDNTPEYAAKLMYAAKLLDKVASNLRHSTKEVSDARDKPLERYSDFELSRTIAERHGIDTTGKGTDSAH